MSAGVELLASLIERRRDSFAAVRAELDNAGIHAFEPRTTPDGYPEMIAVNYLAPGS